MNTLLSLTRYSAWLALAASTAAIGLTVAVAGTPPRNSHKPQPTTSVASSVSLRLCGETAGTRGGGVDAWVAAAERAVAANPQDADALRALAIAFMRKQRQCGDPDYY